MKGKGFIVIQEEDDLIRELLERWLGRAGDGQRVLVVDDEEPLVRLATRTLEELGYVAIGFTSSTAALSAFRADPQLFDAVITDERMPGMSGSSLIREVRGIRGGIPIVLMSGYVGGAVALRARAAGAEEVLQKPLSARDLRREPGPSASSIASPARQLTRRLELATWQRRLRQRSFGFL